VAEAGRAGRPSAALRQVLVPLALAQFICSFAGTNMNVMINDMSQDLDTTVQGIQVAITIFLLVMAALMIPGGKLTDRYGRKRCFTVGLIVYAIGALLSAAAPGLGILILGNSILEGVGTALLIPPVYILTTLLLPDLTSRGPRLRGDQRGRWGRGRVGAADRRPDHRGDQLAGCLCVPGPGHRGDRLAGPAGP
jgi:MFS family permease